MEGRRISHYQVEKKIGSGGMGVVYKATDVRLGRPVALKFLSPELTRNLGILKRFQQEAQTTSTLNHPNVCTVYDVGQVDEEHFIVLEFLEGGTLGQQISGRPLSTASALHFALQIAEALKAAHAREIIHRDIKPSNIHVTSDLRVKVLDFGLARPLLIPDSQENGEAETRVTGGLLGTIAYMSPEQARGEELDARSDLFSLGVVLYEMATGHLPFRGATPALIFDALLHQQPLPPSIINRNTPLSFSHLIMRCLEKDSRQRIQSAAEVIELLQAVLADLGQADARTSAASLAGFSPASAAPATLSSPAASRASDSLPPSVVSRLTPLAGRQEERSYLLDLMAKAVDGNGSLVMLGGEPGIGKTRLVREIREAAGQFSTLALTGHCYEMEGMPSYVPFVEILETLCGVFPPALLQEMLGNQTADIARLVPRMRVLFPDLPPALQIPPEQERYYLFHTICDFLERVARIRPLLMTLEDLHWADEPTLLLLQHLAQRAGASRILILATFRNVELEQSPALTRTLQELIRRRVVEQLTLKPLSQDGVRSMLEAMRGEEPPEELIQAIHATSEGNPFFVEEIFHHLHEEGRLPAAGDEWPADLADHLQLPESVRLVIGKRLERLGTGARQVLTAGALIGRSFGFRLLEALQLMDSDKLLEAVEDGEKAHLIYSTVTGQEARFTFSHALIRQALISELSLIRRQRMHRQIAEAIERVWPDQLNKRAADLAHHLVQAGSMADPSKRRHHLLAAADQALSSAAYEEALRLCDEIDLNHSQELRAAVQSKRGIALRGLGRWEESQEAWLEALSVYEALGEGPSAACICEVLLPQLVWNGRREEAVSLVQRGLSSLPDSHPGERARLLAWSFNALAQGGRYEEAHALYIEAMQLAREAADPRTLHEVRTNLAVQHFYYMQVRDHIEIGEEELDLVEKGSSPLLWSSLSVLSMTAWCQLMAGRPQAALRTSTELETLGSRLGHLPALWFAGRVRGFERLIRTAHFDTFERFARRDLERCQSSHHDWQSEGHVMLGLLDFWRGLWPEAVQKLRQAVELEPQDCTQGSERAALFLISAYSGDSAGCRRLLDDSRSLMPRPGRPNTLGSWTLLHSVVEGLALQGETGEAGEFYPLMCQALETGTAIQFLESGLVQTSAAIAAACAGRWEESEEHFRIALQQADELPHPIENAELHRWRGWMRLRRRRPGDAPAAERDLSEAEHLYQELGMPRHQALAAHWRRGEDPTA